MHATRLITLGILAVLVTAAIVVATTLTTTYRLTGFELNENGSQIRGISQSGWEPVSIAGYSSFDVQHKAAWVGKRKTSIAGFKWFIDYLPALSSQQAWANDVELSYPNANGMPWFDAVGATTSDSGELKPALWSYAGVDPWTLQVLPTLGGPRGEAMALLLQELPAVASSSDRSGSAPASALADHREIIAVGWSDNQNQVQSACVWRILPAVQYNDALPAVQGGYPTWANALLKTTFAKPVDFHVVGAADVDGMTMPQHWSFPEGGDPAEADHDPLMLLPGGTEGEALVVVETQWGVVIGGWSMDDAQRQRPVTWMMSGTEWEVMDIGVPQGSEEGWVAGGLSVQGKATLVGSSSELGKAKRKLTTWKKATLDPWLAEDLTQKIQPDPSVVPEVGVGVDPAGNILGYGALAQKVLAAAATGVDPDTLYGFVLEPDPPVHVGDTPAAHRLEVASYPNPFNPTVTVTFTSPRAGYAKVTVHDAGGRLLARLYDGRVEADTENELRWSGIDAAGQPVSSGVYFVRVQAAGEIASHKIVLMK
jgi:hypothetical protein